LHSVEHLVVGADGTVYTACPPHPSVIRWSGESDRKQLGEFATQHGIKEIAIDPGSGRLFAPDGRCIHRLTPTTVLQEDTNPALWENHPRRLAFTPGGRVLVVGMTNQVLLADPRTLRITARLNDPDLRRGAHEEYISSLAVHPTRPLLATAGSIEDRR